MAALVILCGIIAIVIGVWYNINYGKFTPKIEIFSDGTGRMLFLGVSERCKKQMVRFNAEYQVGQIINYQGQKYGSSDISSDTAVMQCIKSQSKVFLVPKSIGISFHYFNLVINTFNFSR